MAGGQSGMAGGQSRIAGGQSKIARQRHDPAGVNAEIAGSESVMAGCMHGGAVCLHESTARASAAAGWGSAMEAEAQEVNAHHAGAAKPWSAAGSESATPPSDGIAGGWANDPAHCAHGPARDSPPKAVSALVPRSATALQGAPPWSAGVPAGHGANRRSRKSDMALRAGGVAGGDASAPFRRARSFSPRARSFSPRGRSFSPRARSFPPPRPTRRRLRG